MHLSISKSKQLPIQSIIKPQNSLSKSIVLQGIILNKNQQELAQIYERQEERDIHMQYSIKQKLNKKYFLLNRSLKRRKIRFDQEVNQQQLQMKKRLSNKLRSLINTSHSPSRSITIDQSRPFTRKQAKSENKRINQYAQNSNKLSKIQQSFSLGLEKIIDCTSKKNETKDVLKRKKLLSITERNNLIQMNYDNQKYKIIDKMAQSDIQSSKLYKTRFASLTPQCQRQRYEQLKLKQLSNFQKYNMSFLNYMRYKTYKNLQNSIYNEKVKLKDSYTQKFQDCILQQYKLSDQHKLKLQTIFKSINNTTKLSIKDRKTPIPCKQ